MIYTTGTIAINGNTVKGTGTNFSEPLSLIRVGCTLIAVGNPVQIFTITEIKSGTELSVTPAANPTIAAGTKFSILLSDSISVDGLAQDVAETLRYYQSKESEIADAVEFFSDNKDVISASKLASTSAATATNAATTATTAADSAKTYRDEAHQYANQTAQPYAYVLQPLPDVWIPFNDSLDMITGYGPGTKKVTIDGEEKTISSDKVVSFSRASAATYINKSGVLTVAGINEPRFEREGLLIEGTRTNYLLNSNSPDSWNKTSSVGIESLNDGRFNYGRVTVINSSPTAVGYQVLSMMTNDAISGTTGDYVTSSCRVKAGANSRLRLRIGTVTDGVTAYYCNSVLDLTNGEITSDGQFISSATKDGDWWFFESIFCFDADISIIARYEILCLSGESIITSGAFLDLATPQIEKGSCASSFIISGSAPTTRASDMLNLPYKNNMTTRPLSCIVEVNKNWDIAPNPTPRICDAQGFKTTEDAFAFAFSTTGDKAGSPYVQFGRDTASTSGNHKRKIIAAYRIKDNGSYHAVVNGVLSSQGSTAWKESNGAASIRIGGQTSDGSRHLFGHIRNFRIWHKALTDSQLSEIV
ncbi:phage tail protein [Escherichia coli]|uniref:phage head spike fiber domain-containing protein n=1 Tax=Escherichia coli TaxID=562 RepID=UPI0019D191A8|nr:phage tail protein [Escherichia coli]MBN6200134.1 phage tail protein [Escherichia coli]